MRFRWLLAMLLCGVGSLMAAAAPPSGEWPGPTGAGPRLEVQVQDGRLTVRLDQAPWAAVLEALERQTGVAVVARDPLPGTVPQSFEALALEQGLRRLFRVVNVLFVYAHGRPDGAAADTLTSVWLFPKEESPVAAGISFTAPPEARGAVEQMAQAPSGTEGPALESDPTMEQDQGARLSALYGLAEQGDVVGLQQGVFDLDQTLQATAVELLAALDHRSAVTLLVEAMQSAPPEQRLRATVAGAPFSDHTGR